MTKIAHILMPRLSPPRNNTDLTSETQLGIEMEEMARLHKGSPPRTLLKETFSSRFARLIEHSQWQLLLNGVLRVAEPEKPERLIGSGEVAEVNSKNALRKAIYENAGDSCFVIANSATVRNNMQLFDELREEPGVEVVIYDGGFLAGDRMTAENHVKFFQTDVVLVAVGGEVGRIFQTKPKFDTHEIGGDEFYRASQKFYPDLIRPDLLLVCNQI